jgi:CheY-like chemotaxis protein
MRGSPLARARGTPLARGSAQVKAPDMPAARSRIDAIKVAFLPHLSNHGVGRRTGEYPMAKVLIADDEPALREIYRRWLEEAGHDVEEASDGDQALDRLRRGGIDVLILDVVMPGCDGIDVLRTLLQLGHRLRVVTVSGGGPAVPAPIALKLAQALGVASSLLKPVARAELLRSVEDG